jgi:hypothetical protein
VPFVDRGAKEQSLVGCAICKRGFPLSEMQEHTWDGHMWLCPDCHRQYHDPCHCFEEADDAE